jgi:hypothetical protein
MQFGSCVGLSVRYVQTNDEQERRMRACEHVRDRLHAIDISQHSFIPCYNIRYLTSRTFLTCQRAARNRKSSKKKLPSRYPCQVSFWIYHLVSVLPRGLLLAFAPFAYRHWNKRQPLYGAATLPALMSFTSDASKTACWDRRFVHSVQSVWKTFWCHRQTIRRILMW